MAEIIDFEEARKFMAEKRMRKKEVLTEERIFALTLINTTQEYVENMTVLLMNRPEGI